ncbi:MAG TPA: hypothetical protein VJR89_35315 [Polyangiales bacterium]|nr:hypothetical protein [Polyangiales bacterium]
MYAEIFSNASFLDALLELDRDFARQAKQRGCPRCGSVLDIANYSRKPRAGPYALRDEHACRLSLCCRREGCRLRVTPPSVRFLGRRVYLSVVVLLGGVLRQGPTPWRLEALRRVVGADRRTLERWRRWWVERVGSSRVFEIGRADFMPAPGAARLPLSLLESFVGAASERILHALRWLAHQFGSRFPTAGGGHAELAR